MIKKIIYLFVFMLFYKGYSQHDNSIFIGDWVWKENNQTFKVHFYEEGGILKGDYQLSEKDKIGENKIVYKSNKLMDEEFELYYGHAISGTVNNNNIFSGVIRDNVLFGDKIHAIRNGALTLRKNEKNAIIWEVSYLEVKDDKEKLTVPEKFTIPTNIILIPQKK